ncbi:aminoglycoside phosphotransferase family protein [Nocardioides sp.]|uniref:aminoglycoside phosphotransferase family protein n=1 Tax=Nocardioides sp. TaxID=35761 RepID=UPI002ECFE6FB
MTEYWRSADLVDRAHAWIDDRLAELGIERTGEVAQPHVEEWSTVMRVPTADDTVWFKANHEPLRHEAALTALVAARAPERVPALLAFDAGTGWMLMRDAGRRLREAVEEERSLARWHDVLEAYARVQLACEDDVDALLALGVPDRRLPTLAEAYAALLLELGDADPRWPSPDRVDALCRELSAYGVHETLQHDDLHDGQVFLGEGTHLLLDWGDSCVSHPFFSLSVTLEGVIAWGLDDVAGSEDLTSYVESYLRPYHERYDADLDAAVALAMRLGWICRAVNGHLPTAPDMTRTRLGMFVDGQT